jgi:hypothetical protein
VVIKSPEGSLGKHKNLKIWDIRIGVKRIKMGGYYHKKEEAGLIDSKHILFSATLDDPFPS